MIRPSEDSSFIRAPIAIVLAWLLPGLGHIYLGHKGRGVIFLVAITVTFWTGVAIGGVKTVSDVTPPYKKADFGREYQMKFKRSWWFFGQLMTGSYAIAAYSVGKKLDDFDADGNPRYLAWPCADIGNVYSGVAGLLNLLVIIDALARAEGIGIVRRRGSAPVMTTGPPGAPSRQGGSGGPHA